MECDRKDQWNQLKILVSKNFTIRKVATKEVAKKFLNKCTSSIKRSLTILSVRNQSSVKVINLKYLIEPFNLWKNKWNEEKPRITQKTEKNNIKQSKDST